MKNNGIKDFRNRLHIKTQAELANFLGVEQTSVSIWELGKSLPGSKIMKKLLEMGATVEELFGVEYNEIQQLAKIEKKEESSLAILQKKFQDMESRMAELEAKKEPAPAARMAQTG